MAKRIRLEVCPQGKRAARRWKLTKAGELRAEFERQRDAIKAAITLATQMILRGELVTLKIKRPNGQIREERTYPRGSDPRRTKG